MYPFPTREAVCGAQGIKDLQVNPAGKQERALVCNLMEIVISPKNIWRAYQQVKQNKGAGGIDGMQVEDFATWFKEHGSTLIEELRSGNYQPQRPSSVAQGERLRIIGSAHGRHPSGQSTFAIVVKHSFRRIGQGIGTPGTLFRSLRRRL